MRPWVWSPSLETKQMDKWNLWNCTKVRLSQMTLRSFESYTHLGKRGAELIHWPPPAWLRTKGCRISDTIKSVPSDSTEALGGPRWASTLPSLLPRVPLLQAGPHWRHYDWVSASLTYLHSLHIWRVKCWASVIERATGNKEWTSLY